MSVPVPYRYESTHAIAAVVAEHPALAPGDETGAVVTVAGRLMLRRDQGKLVFGQLQDATGRIQIFAPAATTLHSGGACSLRCR